MLRECEKGGFISSIHANIETRSHMQAQYTISIDLVVSEADNW